MSRSRATTIGNFDGVHLGHVALLRAARETVGPDGTVTVLSFDPHPTLVLRPGEAPARLTTWPERCGLLEAAGADEVVRLAPTPDLLSRDPDSFIDDVVRSHQPDVIVEGADFQFGRGRKGDVKTLQRAGATHGFIVQLVSEVEAVLDDQSLVRVSSSLVRWLLDHGRVADASHLLDRPYAITGVIEKGDQRGRDLGFPTANLNAGGVLVPADGIYAGWVDRDGQRWPAALSVGTKPTFGEHARTCEAHLIGYNGPLDDYGWSACFAFTHWLREQVAYLSLDHLIDQINRDIARVVCLTQRTMAAAS